MPLKDILLATLVVTIWGGNFIAAKVGMQHFPPMFYTAMRFGVVGLVCLPFLRKPSRTELRLFFWLAITLGTIHFALMFGGLYVGLSVSAGVLAVQLGVPFSCLLGMIFFKDRLRWLQWAGMALAFAGLVLVAGAPDVTAHMDGFLMIVGAAFIWAISNIISKKLVNVSVMQMLGWMSVFCVPMLLALSALMEPVSIQMIKTAPTGVWVALTYTVVFYTFIAYGTWYALLHRRKISQIAPFNLISPIVGIAGGQWFFDEPLTWQMGVGGLITLTGVAIIILRRPKVIRLAEGA